MKTKLISILVVTLVVVIFSAGCTTSTTSKNPVYDRLNNDPSLVIACQSEYWLNTTHDSMITNNVGETRLVRLRTLYYVCYSRDSEPTITIIGNFNGVDSAFIFENRFNQYIFDDNGTVVPIFDVLVEEWE